MKILDIKGERALDLLADLVDPVSVLAQDEKLRAMMSGDDKVGTIKYLLKEHKKEVITCLAIANDEDPETYEPSILSLPRVLLEFFNDPTVSDLFGFQSQDTEKTSSGSATGNTEAKEK